MKLKNGLEFSPFLFPKCSSTHVHFDHRGQIQWFEKSLAGFSFTFAVIKSHCLPLSALQNKILVGMWQVLNPCSPCLCCAALHCWLASQSGHCHQSWSLGTSITSAVTASDFDVRACANLLRALCNMEPNMSNAF